MTTTHPRFEGTTARREVSEREARRVVEETRQTEWDRPSFAKELYLGRFRLDLIHPHAKPSAAEQARTEAFLADLRAVCESELDGSVVERESFIPDEYLKALARLGVFGMKIPQEYGGLGFGQIAYNQALMLIGSVHPSLGALVSAHQSIGVPEPVMLFGTEEQKRVFLPRCARGAITAFLLTEPDVGSDPARLAASATPVDGGTAYELNGLKLWTTNGVIAELVVVMARVPTHEDGRGGITAFIVESGSPGITVERRNAFMGLKGIENGLTRFENVRVPAANRLAREGDGLKIALTTLNTGRLSIPALCTGASKWCVKIGREWAATRVQLGRPVGEHAAISHKISFMAATAFAQEAVLDLSAHLADAGHHDIRIEAALAKLWSSEMAWLIADELVQIRGGRGYETAESLRSRGERAVPAEQILRDVRINRIFEGSTEIMHLFIAREAVDAHLQAAGDVIDPDVELPDKAKAAARAAGFYAQWLPQLVAGRGQLPSSFTEFKGLARHLRYVERASRRLARQTFYGMARWQGGLEHRQGFLFRVVDIGAELFAMAASCVRAQTLRQDGDLGAAQLADVFCRQARLRVERLFDALWQNTDAADVRLAKAVLAGQHSWLESGVLDQSEGTGPWIAEPRSTAGSPDLHRFIR